MESSALYNWIEIFLWGMIGLTFLIKSVKSEHFTVHSVIAGITFILFGISDAIELQTGSWWKPWWLFAVKAGCVITFFTLFIMYKAKNKEAGDNS